MVNARRNCVGNYSGNCVKAHIEVKRDEISLSRLLALTLGVP